MASRLADARYPRHDRTSGSAWSGMPSRHGATDGAPARPHPSMFKALPMMVRAVTLTTLLLHNYVKGSGSAIHVNGVDPHYGPSAFRGKYAYAITRMEV